MVDIYLVVDLSGSMNTMGKSVVAASVLQTLSSLDDLHFHPNGIRLHKRGWNGSLEEFLPIVQWCAGKPTILLTDGYALHDNCRSKDCKVFFRDNSKYLFVVLCGADAIDISRYNDFKGMQIVRSENILCVVEKILSLAQQDIQDGTDSEGCPIDKRDSEDGWE